MKRVLERISYHAVYDASIIEALRWAGGNGFAGVQVAVETPHLSFEGLSAAECDEIAHFCADSGLYVTLHGPDETASLFASNRHLVEGVFSYYGALFDFAERIGCGLVTFHAGSMTTFATDDTPVKSVPEMDLTIHRRVFSENLARLIDTAAGRFVLCVENYRTDQIVLEVVQPHLDSGRLFLCWDLAKTYGPDVELNEELEGCLWRNLGRVRQVHLHDIRGGRSHRVIGTGRLEFVRFLPRLAQADVRDYCIEVRPRERAAESLANLRRLIGDHEDASGGGLELERT